MKARTLKHLLNDTKYIVADFGEYISVGSPLCHDLIKIDKKSLKMTYALDTFHKGREALTGDSKKEILIIWDKLQELIDNKGILEIINGNDELTNPLPVYSIRNGELLESSTDCYGWPNVTIEGFLMYDNTWFRTKQEAVSFGIRDCTAGFES